AGRTPGGVGKLEVRAEGPMAVRDRRRLRSAQGDRRAGKEAGRPAKRGTCLEPNHVEQARSSGADDAFICSPQGALSRKRLRSRPGKPVGAASPPPVPLGGERGVSARRTPWARRGP